MSHHSIILTLARSRGFLRGSQEGALSSFADGSIDLLHVRERWGGDAAASAFEAWLPKMSERGLVLFDHDVAGGDEATARFFREIGAASRRSSSPTAMGRSSSGSVP